jgi:hypothetical protein
MFKRYQILAVFSGRPMSRAVFEAERTITIQPHDRGPVNVNYSSVEIVGNEMLLCLAEGVRSHILCDPEAGGGWFLDTETSLFTN